MGQIIRMQDPLKQGLKQKFCPDRQPLITIRMQDPLKQGLKPIVSVCGTPTIEDSNARSIKTRIETS